MGADTNTGNDRTVGGTSLPQRGDSEEGGVHAPQEVGQPCQQDLLLHFYKEYVCVVGEDTKGTCTETWPEWKLEWKMGGRWP